MSIDPEWMRKYQEARNQAVHDYMICLELEFELEEPNDVEEE